jgi:dihydrofolate synthase / folylpolyglutamate synthase
MQPLQYWLDHALALHPTTMEFGLERVRAVASRMQLKLTVPLIIVAGTNGKGSTCAMLEAILQAAGYRVGLHTSPHLVRFNERCRINLEQASDTVLATAMAQVEAARGDTSLTFFEFTLLAFVQVFMDSALDAVILEVGLGGRLDAVNIFDADCSIITSIDLDHTEYLGATRELIGTEKAGIMRAGKPVVCSDPVPPASIELKAQALGADLRQLGRDFNYSGDKLQWAWAGRAQRRAGLGYPALRGANQLLNASGVLAALEALRERLPVGAQDVRNGLAMVELPGRFQVLPGQPTVVLDAAHNPHSVAALAANLDNMGFFPLTIAVFGAMADKDLSGMLKSIAPLIDHWVVCDLPTPRAATAAALKTALVASGIAPESIDTAATPIAAFECAQARVKSHRPSGAPAAPSDGEDHPVTARIVVFGSFYTVGGVLEHGTPKLAAPHLA